jgi:hypothetical protein
MNKIFKNWNTLLKESKKKKIEDLKYGELTLKRHKDLVSQLPKFIDIELSDIPIVEFPSNNSLTTKSELRNVFKKMSEKDMDQDILKKTDEDPLSMFTDLLKKEKIKFSFKKLDQIYKDVSKIILKLKVRYNRPRPEQLGPLLGFDIKSLKTDTDNTPSFPSGHTAQAWTMAYYLSDKHPKHEKSFHKIAKTIEDSRVIRGAHYPSDNKEAKKIAKTYLYPNISDK